MSASAPLLDTLDDGSLHSALECEVYDENGKAVRFGELVRGRKVAVVFIRHFFCNVCQTYLCRLGEGIPPGNLPSGTSILIVGCGQPSAIVTYRAEFSSYPVYADPSLSLYKALGFESNIAGSKPGEERQWEQGLGGPYTRLWNALTGYAARNLGQVGRTGPIRQNGGEMVLEADGSCGFFHRMRHSADHVEVFELAQALGAEYNPPAGRTEGDGQDAGGGGGTRAKGKEDGGCG